MSLRSVAVSDFLPPFSHFCSFIGVEANECIQIYLDISASISISRRVSSKEEVDSPEVSCMKPIDLNDFFDGDGKIYGYEGLKINVWINSISLHSYVDITYQSTTNGDKGITDLKSALQNIFAETIVENKDEFLQTFSTERNFIRCTPAGCFHT